MMAVALLLAPATYMSGAHHLGRSSSWLFVRSRAILDKSWYLVTAVTSLSSTRIKCNFSSTCSLTVMDLPHASTSQLQARWLFAMLVVPSTSFKTGSTPRTAATRSMSMSLSQMQPQRLPWTRARRVPQEPSAPIPRQASEAARPVLAVARLRQAKRRCLSSAAPSASSSSASVRSSKWASAPKLT